MFSYLFGQIILFLPRVSSAKHGTRYRRDCLSVCHVMINVNKNRPTIVRLSCNSMYFPEWPLIRVSRSQYFVKANNSKRCICSTADIIHLLNLQCKMSLTCGPSATVEPLVKPHHTMWTGHFNQWRYPFCLSVRLSPIIHMWVRLVRKLPNQSTWNLMHYYDVITNPRWWTTPVWKSLYRHMSYSKQWPNYDEIWYTEIRWEWLEQNSYFKFKTSNKRHIGDMFLAILGSELSEFREIL